VRKIASEAAILELTKEESEKSLMNTYDSNLMSTGGRLTAAAFADLDGEARDMTTIAENSDLDSPDLEE
jgi:hypothetical protein